MRHTGRALSEDCQSISTFIAALTFKLCWKSILCEQGQRLAVRALWVPRGKEVIEGGNRGTQHLEMSGRGGISRQSSNQTVN